jgi:hypothetical protein
MNIQSFELTNQNHAYKNMKVKLFGIGDKTLTNKHPFPQANCLQILVESPSILSLQIFATGPTFLTFNQTHYERNDLIG